MSAKVYFGSYKSLTKNLKRCANLKFSHATLKLIQKVCLISFVSWCNTINLRKGSGFFEITNFEMSWSGFRI